MTAAAERAPAAAGEPSVRVKIRYYVTRHKPGSDRAWGYWAPCLARRSKISGKIEPTLMAALGFHLVDCGLDGPLAWSIAENWNRKWDAALAAHRAGASVAAIGKQRPVYPRNSIGEAYENFRDTATFASKQPRTQEDWERGWKLIAPQFGDVDPRTVALDHVDLWYGGDPNDATVQGLLQREGVREAHRGMKIWRALWKVMAAMSRADGERYVLGSDPSLGIRRKTPVPRNAIWLHEEAVRLVKRAFRMDYAGLGAALAVAWDSQLSPVDLVALSQNKLIADEQGPMFTVDRQKSGRGAIATVTPRTARIFRRYVARLPFALHPDTPFFHTRGGTPVSRGSGAQGRGGDRGGGRPRAPVPYTVDKLGKDFAVVRSAEFPGDRRQLADFRRSGGVEAIAGRVDLAWLAAKMGNSIDRSKFLQQTYLPQVSSVVRLADEARARGRERLKGGSKK